MRARCRFRRVAPLKPATAPMIQSALPMTSSRAQIYWTIMRGTAIEVEGNLNESESCQARRIRGEPEDCECHCSADARHLLPGQPGGVPVGAEPGAEHGSAPPRQSRRRAVALRH